MPEEPTAVGMPGDGGVPTHELVQGRRAEIDVSHQDDLGHVDEPGRRDEVIVHKDLEGFSALTDRSPARLHVQG
jgi:hypothetical protein